MNNEDLALIQIMTRMLKQNKRRYLAEIEDGALVIRIFKGLDES